MQNFIFISPNFPVTYWKFCAELKNNGLRVLGIGDCPYAELDQHLRESLDEYYKVSTLENYDEVFKAVAFFTYKYGKIDWLESNNEYWLERDAHLRTEFNITSGFKDDDISHVKYKSLMKEYYKKAGVPTARYHVIDAIDDAKEFIDTVGYPVIVKPDNGVGASHTYRLSSDDELEFFFANKDDETYIMEEFVNGYVRTYDAIIDQDGEPIFESGNVTPESLMDVVNEARNTIYYIVPQLPDELIDIGHRTVKAFGVKARFIHLEYFVLNADQEGLGKKGDIVGLEVNMRPSGGYTPDMYDYAYETDVYKLWADMIAFNKPSSDPYKVRKFCAFCGRRDGMEFNLNHEAIMAKYGPNMRMWGRIPDALADAMSNQMYTAVFDTEEEMNRFFEDLLTVKE